LLPGTANVETGSCFISSRLALLHFQSPEIGTAAGAWHCFIKSAAGAWHSRNWHQKLALHHSDNHYTPGIQEIGTRNWHQKMAITHVQMTEI
jgi:hypothetical protein